jgi:hypothetical protein
MIYSVFFSFQLVFLLLALYGDVSSIITKPFITALFLCFCCSLPYQHTMITHYHYSTPSNPAPACMILITLFDSTACTPPPQHSQQLLCITKYPHMNQNTTPSFISCLLLIDHQQHLPKLLHSLSAECNLRVANRHCPWGPIRCKISVLSLSFLVSRAAQGKTHCRIILNRDE